MEMEETRVDTNGMPFQPIAEEEEGICLNTSTSGENEPALAYEQPPIDRKSFLENSFHH